MNQYLALSLGPIYNTLKQARKTRELWAASFLFSSLMFKIIKELENQVTILLPQQPTNSTMPLFGAGIYPDRLFAIADGLDEAALTKLLDTAVNNFVNDVIPQSKSTLKSDAVIFWQDYLRIVHVFLPSNSPVNGQLILQLNQYLDTLELQPTYFASAPKLNFLTALLDEVYGTQLRKALGEDPQFPSAYKGLMDGKFPSTANIASFELYERLETRTEYEAVNTETAEQEDDGGAFYKALFDKSARPILAKYIADYHKYFCIVHVDGDSFGDTIAALSNAAAITSFSEELANYASKAAGIINDFGGKPVYIGGDDLVFFAPVRTTKGTIFGLLEKLDEAFAKLSFKPQPTLSFGLTLSYYKFPLFEARDLSYGQLFYRAKKYKRGQTSKNAVAFRFLKHSGSYFEGMLNKAQLKSFNGVLSEIEKFPEELFSSIMFKLETLSPLMDALVGPASHSIPKARLENLFDNFFNEPIHKKHQTQMKLIQTLIIDLYGAETKVDGETLSVSRNLYALLRLLSFMTIPKHKKNLEHA